jgi:hypothetical protein
MGTVGRSDGDMVVAGGHGRGKWKKSPRCRRQGCGGEGDDLILVGKKGRCLLPTRSWGSCTSLDTVFASGTGLCR